MASYRSYGKVSYIISCHVMSRQIISYHVVLAYNATSILLYHTIPYYTILYYTVLYYTILYYTILYYTIPYHTIPYHTMLCYAMLCYAVLYNYNYNIMMIFIEETFSLKVVCEKDLGAKNLNYNRKNLHNGTPLDFRVMKFYTNITSQSAN